MPVIKYPRHVNGQSVSQKDFQRAIVESIAHGNHWPADVASALGWNETNQERLVIKSEMNQMIRFGWVAPPVGYSVTREGHDFLNMKSAPPLAGADHSIATMPDQPTVPSSVRPVAPKPAQPTGPSPLRPVAPKPVQPTGPSPVRPAALKPVQPVAPVQPGRSRW